MDAQGIVAVVLFVGFIIINSKYSKKDGRFKNGFRPDSLSLKGWIIQLLWLAGMGLLFTQLA